MHLFKRKKNKNKQSSEKMGNTCDCQRGPENVGVSSPISPHQTSEGQKNASAVGNASKGTNSTVTLQLTEDEESSEEDDDDVVEDLPEPTKYLAVKKGRQSVSAEAYGQWNKRENFKAPVYQKTAEQKERISSVLDNSFLFNGLDVEDIDTVIKAFQEKKVEKGETIIKQGDDGDKLYLIENGEVDVFKKTSDSPEDKHMCIMKPGDAFGELALMYNAPRAATVIAKTNLTLWCLDRESFNHIVKDAAQRKREMFEEILKEVKLFGDMEPYERNKLADALKTENYQTGDKIIKEGEQGDTFYILMEGTAEAVKHDKVVMEYKKGDYFGELALLKNQPRAASVVAKSSPTQVAYMDRRSFKRLLGPVEVILMRNVDNYKNVLKQMGMDAKYLDS